MSVSVRVSVNGRQGGAWPVLVRRLWLVAALGTCSGACGRTEVQAPHPFEAVAETPDLYIPDGPTPDLPRPRVLQIAAGGDHTCARRDNGAVVCWGADDSGELGNSGTTTSIVPSEVPGVAPAIDLVSGESLVCVRRADGAVLCWGLNFDGQLGEGTRLPRVGVAAVQGLGGPLAELALDGDHSCGRRADGVTLCWGENDSGELGVGGSSGRLLPAPISLVTIEPMARGGGALISIFLPYCSLREGMD